MIDLLLFTLVTFIGSLPWVALILMIDFNLAIAKLSKAKSELLTVSNKIAFSMTNGVLACIAVASYLLAFKLYGA